MEVQCKMTVETPRSCSRGAASHRRCDYANRPDDPQLVAALGGYARLRQFRDRVALHRYAKCCRVLEQKTLVGLTSLISSNLPMPPKFNRRRALFVLGKIDEILAWKQQKETERDTKVVELGRYLCEVRAGQYWRLEDLKCFDEFLERRFPGSRRKAYYLMSIHEHLPPQARKQLKELG
jgi:hypothetical protein